MWLSTHMDPKDAMTILFRSECFYGSHPGIGIPLILERAASVVPPTVLAHSGNFPVTGGAFKLISESRFGLGFGQLAAAAVDRRMDGST